MPRPLPALRATAATLLRGACVVLALDLAFANVDEDLSARERAASALRGLTLRVTYTTVENPYIFKKSEGGWTGVLKDFLDELSREVGFNYEYIPVSNESLEILGSSNTGCARDVSRNRTDLCVGNSWVTTQRLGYAKVLPTLWFETLQLGVRETKDGGTNSFWFAVFQAFKPFDGFVWLAIVVVIILYAFFIWYAEHAENDADYPDKDVVMSGGTSLYHGFFGFVWSDPPTQPVTAEGRVLALGFGFFTLIMMSSYTASLASVLVATNKGPEYEDLQDAIDSGATVCMWLSVLSRAEKLYPGLRSMAKNMGGSYEDGYNLLASGACKVILVDEIFHAKAQERSERDCDKILVGGPVVDINCAWPAADWLVGPLSYFVTDLMSKGVLDDLRRVYAPRVLCDAAETAEEQGLFVANVSGVLFILGGFFLTTAAVFSFKKWFRKARQSGALDRLTFRKSQTSAPEALPAANLATVEGPTDDVQINSEMCSADGEFLMVEKGSAPGSIETPLPMAQRDTGRRGTAGSIQSAFARANSMQSAALAKARKATRNITTGSKQSIDQDSPGYAVVHAYRQETQLSELPFVKALLIMAEVQAKANRHMLRTLRQLESKDPRADG